MHYAAQVNPKSGALRVRVEGANANLLLLLALCLILGCQKSKC
jgi:hypothetical protein